MKAIQTVRTLSRQVLFSLWQRLGELMPLHPPALLTECILRFSLAAALTGARVFTAYAPFALGFVAASGSGPGGLAAVIGAAMGYLTTLGMVSGLRYISAAVFLYAVSYAFYDLSAWEKPWFMPMWAAVVGGLSGVLYLTDYGVHQRTVLAFVTETVLITVSTWLYRQLPLPGSVPGEQRQFAALYLAGTLAAALCGSSLPGVGYISTALVGTLVLMCSARSREAAVSAGVILALALDLCCAGGGLFTGSLTLGALLAGGCPRPRWKGALLFVLGGATAALWNGPDRLQTALVLELAASALLYLALPASVAQAFVPRQAKPAARPAPLPAQEYPSHTLRQMEEKLRSQAKAYRTLYEDMRTGLNRAEPPAPGLERVFDRAAEQVCQDCPRYPLCWKQDYQDTFRAFQQMLNATRQRGHGRVSDAPADFIARCGRVGELVSAANLEYASLLHRRQTEARLSASRSAVWRQYAQLAQLLSQTAGELECDMVPDPEQARGVIRFLRRHGLEGEIRVGRDSRGRLVIRLTGADLSPVERGGLVEELSRNAGMGFAAGTPERERGLTRLTLVQQDNYLATAGVAAVSKEGETVSGDGACWFRDRDGRLWVALCDGMGSGAGAARQSGLALSLLEDFLAAGIDPEIALATLSNALALRGEQELGFTTIDLLGLDLFSGECRSYKLGAGPTYLRQSGRVRRFSGTSLPAGLELGQEALPDVRTFRIGAEDLVVMVSDGVLEGEEDRWMWPLIREYRDKSPRTLAARILAQSAGGGDDRTVLVLQLRSRETARQAKRASRAG
jgi:stage II sporulation protein E